MANYYFDRICYREQKHSKIHLRSLLPIWASLQCRRILGGRNLVRVRNIVVAAIFDFMTVEDWGE